MLEDVLHLFIPPPFQITIFMVLNYLGKIICQLKKKAGVACLAALDFLDCPGVIAEVDIEQILKANCDVFYVHVTVVDIFHQGIHKLREARDRTGPFQFALKDGKYKVLSLIAGRDCSESSRR